MYFKYLTRLGFYFHPRLSYKIPLKNSYTLKKSLYNVYICYGIMGGFGLYWYRKNSVLMKLKTKEELKNYV